MAVAQLSSYGERHNRLLNPACNSNKFDCRPEQQRRDRTKKGGDLLVLPWSRADINLFADHLNHKIEI